MLNKTKKTPEAPVVQGPGVSELLKLTRERSGSDLQTVSQVLRIRFVYLEAIEEGRYEDLPGKTYVVGFVRAYAEFLGLDAEEVVRRFKEEIAGLESKAELVFPSPVTEQSVPGGAVILISLIILGAAYGGWYFLSSQDRSMAELVPDLPAKFSEMVDKVKGTDAKPETAETATEEAPVETATSTEPVTETNTQDMAAAALQAVEKAEEAEEAASVDEPVEEMQTVKVEELQEAQAAAEEAASSAAQETETTTVTETATEAVEKVEEVATATEETVEETVADETATTNTEDSAQEVAETVEEEAPTGPQPMTEVILLKAVDYSWIQVVDADGVEQHTQALTEGEEYQIPAIQGLILRTGNAGGLEIYVDGEKVPSLGETGDVLRRVNLNPTQLLSGSAVQG